MAMKIERFSNVAAMALLCIVPRAGRVARLVCLLGFAWLAVAGGRATTYNIGVRAHATASSEKEPASNAVDGRIRVNGSGAWVSASTVTFWGVIDYPWIQLDWDESVVVSKVLLYDIPASSRTLPEASWCSTMEAVSWCVPYQTMALPVS